MKSGLINDAKVKIAPEISQLKFSSQVSTKELQAVLNEAGDYSIREANGSPEMEKPELGNSSWLTTYKPILLIFGFVALGSAVASLGSENFLMQFMRYFMAGFFLAFSFFKFLDLKGFANAYASYDILAKLWPSYGFIYPFFELGLGLLFLSGIYPIQTYIATIVLMGFSSIGVIRSVLNRNEIKCACLGTVFNLPMSSVTIIEDLLMVAMAIFMLLSSI